MINWEKYRALHPVVNNQIYFMTAGGGAISAPVLKSIIDRYQTVAQNGGRAFFDNIQIMEKCREKIAKLINAEKENIAFIPSVSFGMNALAQSLKANGTILLAKNDFSSSVLPWKNSKHTISWADNSADLVDKVVKKGDVYSAIVASYIHFANGYKIPLDVINQNKNGAHFILNGTQSIGAFPIDVKKDGIDALVCSCYKWMGCGEGIAFMYVNPDFFKSLEPTLIGWRSLEGAMNFAGEYKLYQTARVFELGWDNMTIFAGCDTALDLISEIGIDNISQRIIKLADYLITGLQAFNIPTFSNTDNAYRSGIVLLGPFQQLGDVVKILESNNIWTTQRDGGIRISLHYFNNETDIDHLLNVLKQVCA